ncbi:sugar kinase, ribokinase [Galbibacter orientalis DSM 19592]|uniref:Sugar kinase, ribokinase n=1 Tax=Galbibacter orientalis DSM 19592 TaxID=926559 RepID=I3CAU1_9FLAO|nr:sugar kinase [Galbibacter orientalis]EIJ40734.1 sugar kinase, ribokinase [Galbibacter orientalis DSM 19592]
MITFGELLLRLSTERHLRLSQANSFLATFGGSEFNVAVSLANFGINCEFVTKIPTNELGERSLEEIRRKNVNTNYVIKGGKRLGVYFLETGASSRASNVLYDREDSSFANITLEDIEWNEVFNDADWFHWSGITPAISNNTALICLKALKEAKKRNITISCDLNYRSKMWKYGKEPQEVMPALLKYTDIVLGDIDTACLMIGQPKLNPDYNNLSKLPALYEEMLSKFPNIQTMATTLRYSVNASHQKIGGIIYNRKEIFKATLREVIPVVDRVGSGDAFMAGLIFGLLRDEKNYQYSIDFAAASCCLKHSISGDYNLVNIKEVEGLIKGSGAALVAR